MKRINSYRGWWYAYLLLLALSCTSCRVGQNYHRPSVILPPQFRSVDQADSVAVALVSWRDFFHSPELQELISKALAENFDLQIALKRVEESQAYVRQTRYALLPAVNAQLASSTITPSKNSINGLSLENFIGSTHLEDYLATIGLSWEADIWGKIRWQNQATKATYLQTFEAKRAVRTNLVASVASGYYNLLLLDAQLDIARRNLALSDSIVHLIRLQKESGEVTELAVEQAQAQRDAVALLLPQLEQAIIIEENALQQLLGEMPGSIFRSMRLESFPATDTLLAGIPAQVLANRPDVRARELNLVAVNARIGVAQASMYPTLIITGNGGLNAFRASKWFMLPSSLFYTVAGGMTQPLFERARLRTQLSVAHIQYEQAVVEFRQAVTNGVREVSDALAQVEKLKDQERIATSRVATLQQAIINARHLFAGGMANYLEVITVQSNALQAELMLAQLKQQQLLAAVNLYRALGGGGQ